MRAILPQNGVRSRGVTVLRIRADGLANTRFALSPFAETLNELYQVHRAGTIGGTWSWLTREPVAVSLFGLLTTTKYFPEFIGLPPHDLNTRMDDELDRLRAIPDDSARPMLADSIRHSWADHDRGWFLDEPDVTGRVAAVFERAWREHIAPDWSRRRTIMERDIRYRAGLLATGGWQAAIAGMGRRVRWLPPDGIRFSLQHHPDREIGEHGLTFVPHTGASGSWTCETPPGMALVYPARGTAVPVPVGKGVQSLVGSTRARILRDLEVPATPSQLATALHLSLGTIATHLARLESAGAITRARHGKAVYYQQTETGENLVKLFTSELPV